MNATLASEINRLSPAEKLQLVEELWDALAANEDCLPIPRWHGQLLAEDQTKFENNPSEGSTWTEVKARIIGDS